jgi:hypothetical protein
VSRAVRKGLGSKFPTVKFSRTVSIMSKKFKTNVLFKTQWGRTEFVDWMASEYSGRFNYIYLVLFLVELVLSKKNQMAFKVTD